MRQQASTAMLVRLRRQRDTHGIPKRQGQRSVPNCSVTWSARSVDPLRGEETEAAHDLLGCQGKSGGYRHHAASPAGSGWDSYASTDTGGPNARRTRPTRAATFVIARRTKELKMSDEIPVVPVDRVNWVKPGDGIVAVSLTALGSTLGYVFDPAQAEQLMDGLMGALPQQDDEAPSIGISPGHPPAADVQTVDVTEHDDPPHAIQFHFVTGEGQGVQVRVSLREAMRWQRRLQKQIADLLQKTRS